MKIPFTLDAWLKDKSQKVETRDGRLVHDIWRIKEPSYTNNRRAEVCALIDGEEDALVFFEGGRYLPTSKDTDSPFDLFLITPEQELSEFEVALEQMMYDWEDKGIEARKIVAQHIKELRRLAREEIVKSGYAIVESEHYFEEGRKNYERGKAEALKDLPRWKPAAIAYEGDRLPRIDWALNRLVARFEEGIYYLDIKELYNLPNCFEETRLR